MARPFILLSILILCVIDTQAKPHHRNSNTNINRNHFGRRNSNVNLNTNRFEGRPPKHTKGQESDDNPDRNRLREDPDCKSEDQPKATPLKKGAASKTPAARTTTVSPDSPSSESNLVNEGETSWRTIDNFTEPLEPHYSQILNDNQISEIAEAATLALNKLILTEDEIGRLNKKNYKSKGNDNVLRRKKHKHHKIPKNKSRNAEDIDYNDVGGNEQTVVPPLPLDSEEEGADQVDDDDNNDQNEPYAAPHNQDLAHMMKAIKQGTAGHAGQQNHNSNRNVLRSVDDSEEYIPGSIFADDDDDDDYDDGDDDYNDYDYDGDSDEYYDGRSNNIDDDAKSSTPLKPRRPKVNSKNINSNTNVFRRSQNQNVNSNRISPHRYRG